MHSYQSLGAWQCAHRLARTVLQATDQEYRPNSAALISQLRRAVISVEANLVEGYALGTGPLFRRHLRIALGSAAEVECLVRLGSELGYFKSDTIDAVTPMIDDTVGALYGLVRSHRLSPRRA